VIFDLVDRRDRESVTLLSGSFWHLIGQLHFNKKSWISEKYANNIPGTDEADPEKYCKLSQSRKVEYLCLNQKYVANPSQFMKMKPQSGLQVPLAIVS